MNRALATLGVAGAIASPFAAHDYTARHRIAREQRELDALHAQILREQLEIENIAACTSLVYPLTFRPDGTIALSFKPSDDRAYMAAANPQGCTP